jgi:hypothetical protein
MDARKSIQSQYLAALEMLKDAVMQCPEGLWDDPASKNAFWRVAYHALFYTHLYLMPRAQDFVAWAKDREGYHRMEKGAGEPYSKAEILEYCAVCQQVVAQQVPALDLEAEAGFHWLPFNKLELQFYNIRHLQQHTGELCERLGAQGEVEVRWVGTKPE